MTAENPSIRDTVSNTAHHAGNEARETTRHATVQAREAGGDAAEDVAETGKLYLAERLATVAGALRGVAAELRDDPLGRTVAGEIADASDAVCGFQSRMAGMPVEEIVAEVEGFARRNPALVFGAMFAIGFAAARLVRLAAEPAREPESRPAQSAGSAASPGEYLAGTTGGTHSYGSKAAAPDMQQRHK